MCLLYLKKIYSGSSLSLNIKITKQIIYLYKYLMGYFNERQHCFSANLKLFCNICTCSAGSDKMYLIFLLFHVPAPLQIYNTLENQPAFFPLHPLSTLLPSSYFSCSSSFSVSSFSSYSSFSAFSLSSPSQTIFSSSMSSSFSSSQISGPDGLCSASECVILNFPQQNSILLKIQGEPGQECGLGLDTLRVE